MIFIVILKQDDNDIDIDTRIKLLNVKQLTIWVSKKNCNKTNIEVTLSNYTNLHQCEGLALKDVQIDLISH